MIFGVENGHPRFGARGEISPFSAPFCAPLRLSQTAFSFATDKRPENILDPKRSSQVSRGYAYIQRVHSGLQRERTLISAEILVTQMASSVGERFSNVRTLRVYSASPEAFRELYEGHFGLIAADCDRDPFEARKEDCLRRPASGPLRSTEGPLKLTEHLLERSDGAMNLTKEAF